MSYGAGGSYPYIIRSNIIYLPLPNSQAGKWRKNQTFNNKISLNLDGDAEISGKGFIAPIEYTQYNYHVEWDELANLRVAEPERVSRVGFSTFSPMEPAA